MDNLGLLDILFKTEQFLSLKDEIIKDSLKAILSCLKIQNDKINKIDIGLFNKISREEFNENIKNKVNFSDFMSQLHELTKKGKDKAVDKKEKFTSTKPKYAEEASLLDTLNKDIQNLKIENSMISKKLENITLLNSDNIFIDIDNEKKNKFLTDIKNKLDKNEKDITNITVNFQNKLIKIDDSISNLKMNQMSKDEINQYINDNIKKYEDISLKKIENEFIIINNNINKYISDTIIESNKNKLNNNNTSNNPNIKIDLFLKEIMSKLNIFDDTVKEIKSKFHQKIDIEEIINIYSNIEEIKNNIINQKNEIDIKIKKLNEDRNKNNNSPCSEYEYIMNYFEKDIKNIKLNINDNYNEIKNLKEELANKNKNINNYDISNGNKINNSNYSDNLYSYNNLYPKNDTKNEVAYLKRFINTFMLEVKNENKKSNNMILNLLKEKMNIIDINKVLNQINNDMNNKVSLDLYNNQLHIQNDINNFICKEHILGRWISYKNTPLKNAFIIWDEQLINFAPNNYCFIPNNTHILIKEKGLYLIKIIIFNENKQNNSLSNVQLIIDRKKVYKYSYKNNKLYINEDINNNSFEESMIFEECIIVKNACRIEFRVDGLNYFDNNQTILDNNQNNLYKNKENINAILNIISL